MSPILSFFFHNSMLCFSSAPIIAAFAHSAGLQEEIARLEEDMEEVIDQQTASPMLEIKKTDGISIKSKQLHSELSQSHS